MFLLGEEESAPEVGTWLLIGAVPVFGIGVWLLLDLLQRWRKRAGEGGGRR